MNYFFYLIISLISINLTIAKSDTKPSNISKNKPGKERISSQTHQAKTELSKVDKDEFYIDEVDSITKFKVTRIDGLMVSEQCFDKAKGCISMQTMKENSSFNSYKAGRNPASLYCLKVGGKSLLARDFNHDAYGFCEFPDKSRVEEWSLYNKWMNK